MKAILYYFLTACEVTRNMMLSRLGTRLDTDIDLDVQISFRPWIVEIY